MVGFGLLSAIYEIVTYRFGRGSDCFGQKSGHILSLSRFLSILGPNSARMAVWLAFPKMGNKTALTVSSHLAKFPLVLSWLLTHFFTLENFSNISRSTVNRPNLYFEKLCQLMLQTIVDILVSVLFRGFVTVPWTTLWLHYSAKVCRYYGTCRDFYRNYND